MKRNKIKEMLNGIMSMIDCSEVLEPDQSEEIINYIESFIDNTDEYHDTVCKDCGTTENLLFMLHKSFCGRNSWK